MCVVGICLWLRRGSGAFGPSFFVCEFWDTGV